MKSFERQLDLYAKSVKKDNGELPENLEGSLSNDDDTDQFQNLLSDPRGPFNHGCTENKGGL